MRGIKTILMIPVVAVLLLAGACAGNGLDDGDSADVILEILAFTTPQVTASTNTNGFCSTTTTIACTVNADCPGFEVCSIGGCTLRVVNWAIQLANVPKNSLAAGPANDVALIDVLVTYNFPVPAVDNPLPRSIGLGGQVIVTGGSGTVTFQPIAQNALLPSLEGTTGSLLMNLRAQTLEGTTINLLVARDLTIKECL